MKGNTRLTPLLILFTSSKLHLQVVITLTVFATQGKCDNSFNVGQVSAAHLQHCLKCGIKPVETSVNVHHLDVTYISFTECMQIS